MSTNRRLLQPQSTTAQHASPPLLQAIQAILREFSELLEAVSSSSADNGEIDTKEAASIRKEWEDLKSLTETLVSACESGNYLEDKAKG